MKKKTFNKKVYNLLWDLVNEYEMNNDIIDRIRIEEYAQEIEKIFKTKKS